MKLKVFGCWVSCVLALLWVGCQTPDGPNPKARPSCSFDELRGGDNVTITYSDVPPPGIPEQKVRVKDDGTLSLPLNQSVTAAGKKIGLVEKEIQAMFVPKLYRQMTVTIKTEDRFYFVGGQVKQPGRQIYAGETTVLRAIQSCGDFNDFANQKKVQIIRTNGEVDVVDCKKARRNPKFDLPICPGDSINVPPRLW